MTNSSSATASPDLKTPAAGSLRNQSYLPGAETVTLKLLWSPEDGRVLGSHASGKDGVDKRLDVIATALRGRPAIDDFAYLGLSHAP